MLKLSFLALFLLTLTACQSEPAGIAPTSAQLAMDSWTLDTFDAQRISEFLPQGAHAPTLIIAPDGAVTGNTSINSLGSKLDLDALEHGRFALGPIMTTRRAGPPQLMVLETAYVDNLRKADTYSATATTLTLSQGKSALLTFTRNEKPKPPTPLK